MKLGSTIAALALIGSASFLPATTYAQSDRPTSSGSAPQSSSEQPVQRGPSDPGISFSFHQTGAGGGDQEIVPLAPRGENMASNSGIDSAATNPSVEKPAGQ